MKKLKYLFICLIAVFSFIIILSSCGGDKNESEYNGTYFRYQNGAIVSEDYIIIEGENWSSPEASGVIKIGNDSTIDFWEIKNDSMINVLNGKISNGILIVKKSSGKNKMTYTLENNEANYPVCDHKDEGDDDICDNCGDDIKHATIVFDANGGEFENGKTSITISGIVGNKIGKIQEPTKENGVFDGWYFIDSNGEYVDWSAENATFKDSLLCCARWKYETEEYKVTYVLDYPTANETVVRSTVECFLDEYIPSKDGYSFDGWKAASIVDGILVLGEKFDTSKKITEDIILVAMWSKETETISRAPNPTISCENGIFTWSTSEGVLEYQIVLLDETKHELYKSTIKANTFSIEEREKGTYILKVRAVGNGTNVASSDFAEFSYRHKQIADPVVNFDINTNILSWSCDDQDVTFSIEFNGYSATDLTTYELDMTGFNSGTYEANIYAKKDGYFSGKTTYKFEKLRLKTPKAEERILTTDDNMPLVLWWESDPNADYYYISGYGKRYFNYIYMDNLVRNLPSSASSVTIYAVSEDASYINSYEYKHMFVGKELSNLTVSNDFSDTTSVKIEADAFRYPTYKVSFDLNHEIVETFAKSPAPQYISADESKPGLEEPFEFSGPLDYYRGIVNNKYLLIGWSDSPLEGAPLYDFTKPVTKDMTLYAQWYDISASPCEENYYCYDASYKVGIDDCVLEYESCCYYFVMPKSGTFTLKLYSLPCYDAWSTNAIIIGASNLTKGTTIYRNSTIKYVKNNNVGVSTTFNADHGDVIRIYAESPEEYYKYIDVGYHASFSVYVDELEQKPEYYAHADATYLVSSREEVISNEQKTYS